MTAFAASAVDHFAATRRLHAGSKSVDFFAASFAALVCSFHESFLKKVVVKGIIAEEGNGSKRDRDKKITFSECVELIKNRIRFAGRIAFGGRMK